MHPFFETLRAGNYQTGFLIAACVLGFVGGAALHLYLANARVLRLNREGREQFRSITQIYVVRTLERVLGKVALGLILVGIFAALGLLARVLNLW